MEKTEVVAKIIEYVGGKDNVVNTWHCMTRLRFELKDTSKIQEDAIKALDGVIGVQFAKGQLQIVLGTSVHKYYDIALQMLDLKEDIAAPAQPEKKKDFISWFMDMVSGVFGPIVPAIAGAGMIKGLMGGLVALGVVSNATDTYKIIDMLASGVFTFLPFFIAASAAKKFKTNQYLAIAIAATLMYSTVAFNYKSVPILAHKDAAPKLVISVADCIQNGLSHDALIERKDVKYEKTFLIMLFVVPQIDQLPDAVIARKEAHPEFFPLVCRARCFGRTIFKNNFSLR